MSDLAAQWVLRGEEARFYEFCADKRLMIQRCDVCDVFQFPPSAVCSDCWSTELTWTEVTGRGSIETFSIEMRPGPNPDLVPPYVVAMICLDEGPRMLSNVVASPDAVEIGAEVVVTFRTFGEHLVPVFELASQ